MLETNIKIHVIICLKIKKLIQFENVCFMMLGLCVTMPSFVIQQQQIVSILLQFHY